MYLFIVILFIYLFIIVVCFSVFMLYVAWKRGLPRNLHVLSCFVQFKKRSFNLLYVLNVHLPIYLFLPALTIFWHSFLVLPGDPQQLYVKKKKKVKKWLIFSIMAQLTPGDLFYGGVDTLQKRLFHNMKSAYLKKIIKKRGEKYIVSPLICVPD